RMRSTASSSIDNEPGGGGSSYVDSPNSARSLATQPTSIGKHTSSETGMVGTISLRLAPPGSFGCVRIEPDAQGLWFGLELGLRARSLFERGRFIAREYTRVVAIGRSPKKFL